MYNGPTRNKVMLGEPSRARQVPPAEPHPRIASVRDPACSMCVVNTDSDNSIMGQNNLSYIYRVDA